MPNGIGFGGGGGGAPSSIAYITAVPDATLTAEQALSLLSTGLLKNTGGTLSTAAGADLPSHNHAASEITSGQLARARGGTEVDLSATGGIGFVLKQAASGVISSAALVAGDIPSLPASQLTSGQLLLARGGTGVDLSAAGGANFVMKQAAGGVITSALILSADLTSALTTPPAIGGTTPAAITGTTGVFGTSVKTPIIFPSADSTSAVKITKADGSTGVITVDTTNAYVNIGNGAPTNPLTISKVNTPAVYPLYVSNSDTAANATVNLARFVATGTSGTTDVNITRVLNTNFSRIDSSDNIELVTTKNSGNISLFGTAANCVIEIGAEAAVPKSGNTLIVYNASYYMISDAATNTTPDTIVLRHTSSGTPAAGFGTALVFQGKSSTTVSVLMSRIVSLWNVATHASRAADVVLYASDFNGEREIMRGRANGSAPLIAFLGATPAIQQTGGTTTATIAYTATEQGMLQKAYDALRTFGFLN